MVDDGYRYNGEAVLAGATSIAAGLAQASKDPTIATAISSIEEARARFDNLADQADRLAGILSGPVPEATGAQKGENASGSMVDYLNRRVDALHDPATRIRNALDRIERRIG